MTLEKDVLWGPSVTVQTRVGWRLLVKGVPTQAFWQEWRARKQHLKEQGIQVRKEGQDWEVLWWKEVPNGPTPQERAAIEASRATSTDQEFPCPPDRQYRAFQRAGIEYVLQSFTRAEEQGRLPVVMIADQMGLGKSIEAIGVVNALPEIQNVLIVCPAGLRLNWRRELQRWLTKDLSIGVVTGGQARNWQKVSSDDIVVINYDVLMKHRQQIDKRCWDLLVLDESQYIKSPKAKRTRAVLGKPGLRPIPASRVLFLTGTPILNRPRELFTFFRLADPHDVGANYYRFACRFCDYHETRWGWDDTGASNLEELQTILRSGLMIRRLKEEVLTELPPKQHQVIELPTNGASDLVAKERQIYAGHRALIDSLQESLQDNSLSDDETANLRHKLNQAHKVAFGELASVRHQLGILKAQAVVEYLRDAAEDHPIIVFAHHRDVLQLVAEAFGDQAVLIDGSTPLVERQRAVDLFQAGKRRIFVGQIQAAGVGITLTASSHVIFLELSWVPAELAQASDRAHRIGQQDSVLVQYYVYEDSLDSDMIEKLVEKQEVIDKCLDAR